LAREVYGETELADTGYLEWKYRKNPQGAIMSVCETGDRVIGFHALMPIRVKLRDSAYRWAWGGDSMVHGEFRRQGIFVELSRSTMNQAKGNISVIFGTPDLRSPTALALLKHLENIHAGNIVVQRLYLKPRAVLTSLLNRKTTLSGTGKVLGSVGELGVNLLLGTFAPHDKPHTPSKTEPDFQVQEIRNLTFGQEFDKLWDEASQTFTIAVIRNNAYLNWRFANPDGKYVGYRAVRAGALRGYAVLRYRTENRQQVAYVADLLAADQATAKELLRTCVMRAKEDQANMLLMWRMRHTQAPSRALGFRKSLGRQEPMVLSIDDPSIPRDLVGNVEHWYLTPADTEDWI
jgi:GNAT superfamily N-acetyltransferase